MRWSPTATLALGLPLLAACTDNAPAASGDDASADPRALTVTATDTTCEVSAATARRRATCASA